MAIRGGHGPSVPPGQRAVALFGDYAALGRAERNIARITFLDETFRELHADWPSCARGNVAYLHLDVGRRREDPQLAGLIGEPSMRSADFRRWWAEHPVQDKTSGTMRLHHAVVGDLELAGLRDPACTDDLDQGLITYAAEPGSPSHDVLQMPLAWATEAPSPMDGGRRPRTLTFRAVQALPRAT